jgi:hypothetical protein
MVRALVYLLGLVVVLVAVWLLLTQTFVAAVLPFGIAVVVLLILLGIGLMRMPPSERLPHEITETRQRVGDTELRRSKLE